MEPSERKQNLGFLRDGSTPELKKHSSNNFIRKCRTYIIREDDKLYKVIPIENLINFQNKTLSKRKPNKIFYILYKNVLIRNFKFL